MTSSLNLLVFVVMLIGGAAVMASATWQQPEDTGCASGDGCQEEETNNKFALLFQQMLARQRETNTDCQLMEDCPDGFDCQGGKCRSSRRTKMINLYSRW